MTRDPIQIHEAFAADQAAEDDAARRPMHTIGPYTVHLASAGWYCVMRAGVVEQTFASATEAAFWAAMREDA